MPLAIRSVWPRGLRHLSASSFGTRVISYSAAIQACQAGQEGASAMQLLDAMRSQVVEPDLVSCTVAAMDVLANLPCTNSEAEGMGQGPGAETMAEAGAGARAEAPWQPSGCRGARAALERAGLAGRGGGAEAPGERTAGGGRGRAHESQLRFEAPEVVALLSVMPPSGTSPRLRLLLAIWAGTPGCPVDPVWRRLFRRRHPVGRRSQGGAVA
uniref:Pentacotripeptide-repeat region of PRORP domain-containing protein n=2 Tax=Alexandrium monilatum TaxID=311494 RepID=A0A7S4VV30_9DINO